MKRTGERSCEVQKLGAEVGDLRKPRLYVILEVFHGHRGEVVELVRHFVSSTQARGRLDVTEDPLYLVQYLEESLDIGLTYFRLK